MLRMFIVDLREWEYNFEDYKIFICVDINIFIEKIVNSIKEYKEKKFKYFIF